MLETAIAALRAQVDAAEKRAAAAEADRQAAQLRAEHAEADRNQTNRRARVLKAQLDATQLEVAGLRTLMELQHATTQDADDAEAAQKGWGRRARRRATWWMLVFLTALALTLLAHMGFWHGGL